MSYLIIIILQLIQRYNHQVLEIFKKKKKFIRWKQNNSMKARGNF